jgi:hypothetical protein
MFGYKMKTKYMDLENFLFCFSLVSTENLKNHFFSKFLIFGEISPVKKWLLGFGSTANVDELPKFQLT